MYVVVHVWLSDGTVARYSYYTTSSITLVGVSPDDVIAAARRDIMATIAALLTDVYGAVSAGTESVCKHFVPFICSTAA